MITPRKFYDGVLNEVCDRLLKEVPSEYTYHSLRHTLDVIEMAIEIGKAEHVSDHELTLLKIAALFHDTGYLVARKNHEEESAKIFLDYAEKNKLDQEVVSTIVGCIKATKIPQAPQNHLERILCDADLDYLGREDFSEIGELLYTELTNCNEIADRNAWNQLQVNFLSSLKFHTHYSQQKRQQQLEINMSSVKKLTSL
jgi:predicted metal-dependent HD superfamily phosphohydrolase